MPACHVKPEQMFNLIWGFESIVNTLDGFTLAGGSPDATSSAVPTGKVWVLTGVSVRSLTRGITSLYGGVKTPTQLVYVLATPGGGAQYVFLTFVCSIFLAAGQKVFFTIGGGQNGDFIQIGYSGYQVNLGQ